MRDQRSRDLARIHLLAKQVGLTRDQYEAVLLTHGGTDSAGAMNATARGKVIRHLSQHAKRLTQRPRNADTIGRRETQKIEALLADAGRDWDYALSLARRMYRKEALEFCSAYELTGILAALEKDALRRLEPLLDEALREFGWNWLQAAYAASLLFGVSRGRDLRRYSQGMSLLLRWLRGELAPSCDWPRDTP